MERFDVAGWDGTRRSCWRGGDPGGVPVVVCAGPGSPASAWPGLTGDGAGLDVVGAAPGGGAPDGRDDAARDVLHLVDVLDVDAALVVAWSSGVDVAVRAALLRPEAVAGVLGICGVPGATWRTAVGWALPGPLRPSLQSGLARALGLSGPLARPVLRRVPPGPTALALRLSRAVHPDADQDLLTDAVGEYLRHDPDRLVRAALARGAGPADDPGRLRCPVTLLTGDRDALTPAAAVRGVADGMRRDGADVEVVDLVGTHLLPLERPAAVADETRALARRAGLDGDDPPAPAR